MRWRHPEFGLVSPASFISLAEETGQIVAIGEFVLRQACRQACAWHALGLDWLRVSVNISMHQLRKGDFVELVAAVLAETGLPPAQLELELTETQLSDDVSAVAELFGACARWACAWRSTTSAPAIPRSATSSTCRWTC